MSKIVGSNVADAPEEAANGRFLVYDQPVRAN